MEPVNTIHSRDRMDSVLGPGNPSNLRIKDLGAILRSLGNIPGGSKTCERTSRGVSGGFSREIVSGCPTGLLRSGHAARRTVNKARKASGLEAVNHSTLQSVSGHGDGMIVAEFSNFHDHSLGFAEHEVQCWPETGNEPSLIANETQVSFEVSDVPGSSEYGSRLYIAQHVTVNAAWLRSAGTWEYEGQTWMEFFPLYGNYYGMDNHIDSRPFPEYCRMEYRVTSELALVYFLVPPEDGEKPGIWRNSWHRADENGNQEGDEMVYSVEGGADRVSGHFLQNDPNVRRAGPHRGSYEYEQSIDHCWMVPIVLMLRDGMGLSGSDLYEAFQGVLQYLAQLGGRDILLPSTVAPLGLGVDRNAGQVRMRRESPVYDSSPRAGISPVRNGRIEGSAVAPFLGGTE